MAVVTEQPRARAQAVAEAKPTPPVKMWAGLGAVIVLFEAAVIIKWITGPYFKHVPAGPTHVPWLMNICLIAMQVIPLPLTAFLIYRLAIRPWRRDRHIGVDGILALAFSTLIFQDVLSSAGNHWFVYNTHMINFGSWANSIPGWTAFGKPGAMTSEPILFTAPTYVWLNLLVAFLGCWVMRSAHRRWPALGTFSLCVICFVFMCVFDFVLEGVIWLPMGIYEYPGGHWALFANTYHKYPFNETLTTGAWFSAFAFIRYFVNDRGQTIAERGIDNVQASAARKTVIRVLAAVAVVQIALFLTYVVPNYLLAMNSTAWPKDLQKRSYFTNGICGAGTNRLCPGPGVSIIRNNSVYVGANGKVVVPKGVVLPKIVPFAR